MKDIFLYTDFENKDIYFSNTHPYEKTLEGKQADYCLLVGKEKENMDDLVSVIIPCHNLGIFVARCLESVCNQTYKNLEIVVVDDGSTDGKTSEIIKLFAEADNRIKVITKPNGGVSSARNAGLQACSGKYVLFVDGDDELMLDAVQNLLAGFYDYCTDMVMGATIVKNADGECTRSGFDQTEFGVATNWEFYKKLYEKGLLLSCFKMYRREVIEFKYDETVDWGECELFNLEYFLRAKRVLVLNKPTYIYKYKHRSDSYTVLHEAKLREKYNQNIAKELALVKKLFADNSKHWIPCERYVRASIMALSQEFDKPDGDATKLLQQILTDQFVVEILTNYGGSSAVMLEFKKMVEEAKYCYSAGLLEKLKLWLKQKQQK